MVQTTFKGYNEECEKFINDYREKYPPFLYDTKLVEYYKLEDGRRFVRMERLP